MANDLTFGQLAAVQAAIAEQATGKRVIASIDTSSFVTVGQLALKAGYDPLMTAISQTLSKTIFSARPYSGKLRGMMVDNVRYGNHVRKINFEDGGFEDDQRLALEDGKSIDHYAVKKPKAVQTNFYGAEQLQMHRTIYRDQLDSAMTSPDQFGSFISSLLTSIRNEQEQKDEQLRKMTLVNMAAGTSALSGAEDAQQRVFPAVTNFNSYKGLSGENALNWSTLYGGEYWLEFCKWLFAQINNISNQLTERTSLYHQNFGSDVIMRHTPVSDQRMYLHSELVNSIDSTVFSSVFNPEYLKMIDYETVNFWQSPIRAQSQNIQGIKPSVLDASGNAITGTAQSFRLLGIICDVEALGVTVVNQWTERTPMNAAGGYSNIYWHWTDRYWNDFSENFIIIKGT